VLRQAGGSLYGELVAEVEATLDPSGEVQVITGAGRPWWLAQAPNQNDDLFRSNLPELGLLG
jgi:hypothetical protein